MEILDYILSRDSLPFSDFQNFWMALLTILIPLGIAVLSEYFRKQSSNEDLVVLDLHVILDWILNFKILLAATALVFIPGLFWGAYDVATKYWVIFGWVVGTIFFMKILFNFYQWTKGNKDPSRLEYYKGLSKAEDFLTVSKSIWSAHSLPPRQEAEYLKVFIGKIKELTGI